MKHIFVYINKCIYMCAYMHVCVCLRIFYMRYCYPGGFKVNTVILKLHILLGVTEIWIFLLISFSLSISDISPTFSLPLSPIFIQSRIYHTCKCKCAREWMRVCFCVIEARQTMCEFIRSKKKLESSAKNSKSVTKELYNLFITSENYQQIAVSKFRLQVCHKKK